MPVSCLRNAATTVSEAREDKNMTVVLASKDPGVIRVAITLDGKPLSIADIPERGANVMCAVTNLATVLTANGKVQIAEAVAHMMESVFEVKETEV